MPTSKFVRLVLLAGILGLRPEALAQPTAPLPIASDLANIRDFLNSGAPAQNSGVRETAKVTAVQVTEFRSLAGPSQLNVILSLPKSGLPGEAVLQALEDVRAWDDLNRPVPMKDSPRGPYAVSAGALDGRLAQPAAFLLSASFLSPSRDATRLKSLEGTVRLFLPSEQAGSLVRIAEIGQRRGIIDQPDLTANRLELRFVRDLADFAEIQTEFTIQTPPRFESGVVAYFVRGNLAGFVGARLEDAHGNPLPLTGVGSRDANRGLLIELTLRESLPTDAQLAVFLSKPNASQLVHFRMEDVPLP